jgi:hypothetical protein
MTREVGNLPRSVLRGTANKRAHRAASSISRATKLDYEREYRENALQLGGLPNLSLRRNEALKLF